MSELVTQWVGWDDEQVARDVDSMTLDDGFLKLKGREEAYLLRFLPARVGEVSAISVLWQHYFEFPDKTKFSFNCPRLMAKLPCAGCELIERMRDSGSSNDEKLAKRFVAKSRVISRVIDREHPEKGPRLFGFGKTIFDELKLLRKSARGGDFTNPTERGYDIELYATGEGMEREYKVYPGERGPLASPEQVNEWLAAMPKLESFSRILSDEAIKTGLRLTSPGLMSAPAPRQMDAPRAQNHATARVLDSRPAPAAAPAVRRAPRDDDSPF